MTEKKTWYFGERANYAVMWQIAKPKAVLQIVHGMVEHIERYDEFARFANDAGYLVVGHDHVGHGETVKDPEDYGAFPKNWQDLIADVHTLQREVSKKYPDIPYIILGHSMGSFITRLYLGQYGQDVDKAILMGTGQQPRVQTWAAIGLTKILRMFHGEKYRSKFLEQMSTGMFNRLFAPNKTSADWLSRDKTEVDKYLAHKHHQFTPTLSMYRALFTFSNLAASRKWIKKIPRSLPLLLISGAKDPVGGFGKGVTHFYKILRHEDFTDVTLKLYPDARHEILNELNKNEVMRDLVAWMDDKI
ncbi:alpha/beta fold hydrolase [uncultured Ligilactobacillus sp.]|uniref:alpha/beta fold hydrolase n=1 Tax=uncultured Ligilactobacillus sp. TaxID=2837633 RepID=UPI00272C4EC2|nr:alpha/beta fold hydrolase [uncultured Ligilactobacillus sp.]